MSILLPNTVILTGKQPILTNTSMGLIVPSTLYPLYATAEVDQEHNDNYATQKQMTNYLRYRILDKWLYEEEYTDILKYLTIRDNHVEIVKNEKEMRENNIEKDSEEVVEKKIDFIENEFLSESEMRRLLIKIMEELGYKWYQLASHERVVVGVVMRYLRHKLKERIK